MEFGRYAARLISQATLPERGSFNFPNH
jgi:hypothetical protein